LSFCFIRNRTQVAGFGRYILRKFNIARDQPPNADARELLLKPTSGNYPVLTNEQKSALLTGKRLRLEARNSMMVSPVTTKPSNSSAKGRLGNSTIPLMLDDKSPPTWQLDHLCPESTASEQIPQLPPDDTSSKQLDATDLSHDDFSLLDFGNVPSENQYLSLDSDAHQDFRVHETS
jgi:hypothetical protein